MNITIYGIRLTYYIVLMIYSTLSVLFFVYDLSNMDKEEYTTIKTKSEKVIIALIIASIITIVSGYNISAWYVANVNKKSAIEWTFITLMAALTISLVFLVFVRRKFVEIIYLIIISITIALYVYLKAYCRFAIFQTRGADEIYVILNAICNFCIIMLLAEALFFLETLIRHIKNVISKNTQDSIMTIVMFIVNMVTIVAFLGIKGSTAGIALDKLMRYIISGE